MSIEEIATNPSTTVHPLTPLSATEIDRLREVLTASGALTPTTRLSYVALHEPSRADVLAGRRGPRQAEALLTDLAGPVSRDLVIDLESGEVVTTQVYDIATEGTGPMMDSEYVLAEELVKGHTGWQEALARRGVTDLDQVRVAALSAGVFGYEGEGAIRTARAVAYRQDHPGDLAWAHPISGVVAHLDLTNAKVLRVIETDLTHVPGESADYTNPTVRGPERNDLKPISITQPEGVSFDLEDGVLTWQKWSVRLGYNGREGLTLHQVSFRDGERERPVLYRASIAEMVVNYGDPSPVNDWQNYFDVGEYQFGRMANSLRLGCDCLGEIRYVDAVVSDDLGNPKTLPNAICIHEEDTGILWKHNDVYSGSSDVRRQRRLVISFFLTVGNYDYGFYWYLYLDGAIELETKATGIVFTTGHPGGNYPYSAEVAPGVGAPVHQHLFCARLDTMVDGTEQVVEEVEFASVAQGPENPLGNAIGRTVRSLSSESEAIRDADPLRGRTWRVASALARNRMGRSTGYELHPKPGPLLLSAQDSSVRARAGFATHHLWVTQRQEDQRWPAGRLVNLHPGGAGLPTYVAENRSLDGAELVVWHTFGLTHFPRLEDYPVMPVDHTGFRFLPSAFFDRNPTLDVPAPTAGHCPPETQHCG